MTIQEKYRKKVMALHSAERGATIVVLAMSILGVLLVGVYLIFFMPSDLKRSVEMRTSAYYENYSKEYESLDAVGNDILSHLSVGQAIVIPEGYAYSFHPNDVNEMILSVFQKEGKEPTIDYYLTNDYSLIRTTWHKLPRDTLIAECTKSTISYIAVTVILLLFGLFCGFVLVCSVQDLYKSRRENYAKNLSCY